MDKINSKTNELFNRYINSLDNDADVSESLNSTLAEMKKLLFHSDDKRKSITMWLYLIGLALMILSIFILNKPILLGGMSLIFISALFLKYVMNRENINE